MSRIDQLSGVASFVEAARTGSFTAAADRLGITKSAVGKSIARLEDRLGTRLFYRTTRRSSLTLDGETYFASCASALDEIAAAETALDAGRFKPRGRLRIDMPGAFGRGVILPVLIDIAKAEPDLRFAMSFTDRIVDLVEEGIDLAIRVGPLQDSAGLIARKLTEQTLVICGSPGYLEARGIPTSPDDLQSARIARRLDSFRPECRARSFRAAANSRNRRRRRGICGNLGRLRLVPTSHLDGARPPG